MKRHCLVLPALERWEYPEDAYFHLDFASRHISSSLCVTRPFTNGVEWGWKNCTDPMVGGARSITLYDRCTPSSGYMCVSVVSQITWNHVNQIRACSKSVLGGKIRPVTPVLFISAIR